MVQYNFFISLLSSLITVITLWLLYPCMYACNDRDLPCKLYSCACVYLYVIYCQYNFYIQAHAQL